MTWFDKLVQVVDRADTVLDKVRKTPRKRLAFVPQPNAPPDPFSVPQKTTETVADPPLANPRLPAQLFGKRTDAASGLAVQLFREQGIDATFTNLDDPDNGHLEIQLVRETKQYSLPYVYLRGEFIGGFEALAEIAKSGKLEERTADRS